MIKARFINVLKIVQNVQNRLINVSEEPKVRNVTFLVLICFFVFAAIRKS